MAILQPRAASARPRNARSILVSQENVCALWHKEAPELRRTPLRRSSDNAASRLLDQASSTLRHPPKPGYIVSDGQCHRIRLRNLLYPTITCSTPMPRRRRFGLESTADVLLTKPSTRTSWASRFYWFCRKNREPTSGLEPPTCSLRVCGLWLLGVAGVCKSRIDKEFSVPCIAHYCRVLRPG